MSIFFDVLLVALLLLTVIKHSRLGLACSILNAGRILLSLIVAALFSYPFAAIMYGIGVPSALSGIVAFLVVFFAVLFISKLLVRLLSKIKIPLVTKVDKFLGFILGLLLGVLYVSLLSTSIYTVLEIIDSASADADIMCVYNDSYVFRFIYELKIFEFIRNLF